MKLPRVQALAQAVLLLTAAGLLACAQEPADNASEESFPDVGLGCTAQRIGPDNWQVNCPGEDSTVAEQDAAVPLVDATPSTIDEGVELIDSMVDSVVDAEMPSDAAVGPMLCAPALTINASQTAASPYSLVRFEAAGGTGQWQFAFEENRSGAVLNPTTGTYLAGDRVGVIDAIILTDANCEGSARLEIQIVEPMEAHPSQPELEPGDVIEFSASYGSGDFELLVSSNRSGGELLGGLRYRAGDMTGTDLLVLRDRATRTQQTITVTIRREVSLTVSPRVIYVPQGAGGTISVTGGSGVFDYQVTPGLEFNGDRFQAEEPGTYVVEITDRFGARNTNTTVVVMPSFDADANPINDHTLSERVLALGDVNNDGKVDIAVARAESDGQAHNGGELALFFSQEDGFEAEPDQTIYGFNREDELGRGLTATDVNGDGLTDLLYGVRYADTNGRNSGSLMVHLGQPEGGFGEAPSMILNGPNRDLEFGFSVTTCDFNGDGYLDIAVGARAFEDRNLPGVQWDHGGVLIHLGHQDGFLHTHDQVVTGQMPDENGVWMDIRAMHFGQAVAAGDFDNDGLCDLVASSLSWINQNQGHVFLYRGRRAQGLDPGGLHAQPSMWLTSDMTIHERPEFGRRVAMGDVNGDDHADILIGHNGADHNGARNSGAAHLFMGRVLDAGQDTIVMTSSDADWTYLGTPHDHAGMEVKIVDVDGTPPADVLLTSLYSDFDGRWDSGSIRAFYSQAGALPPEEPNVTIHGLETAFRLGVSAAPLGDINADGQPDFAAMSHYGGTEHVQIGRPFILTSQPAGIDEEGEQGEQGEQGEEAGGPERFEYRFDGLNLNWHAAGSFFGSGVALLGDMDDDGNEEVLIAASSATHPDIGIRSGELWLYDMTARGEILEGTRVAPFLGHSHWDFMTSVRPIGDFDGDGHGDFAVQINNDERPQELDDAYFAPENCTERLNDQGGIYIFRGGPEQFDLTPDFVYWGQSVGKVPDTFVGAGDFNGDGRTDLALGAWRRDINGLGDAGSTTIVSGQIDPAPGQITVICEPQYEYFGTMATNHLGFALSFVDDLNGDGCDELAIGGRGDPSDDLPYRGSVHLMYGFGGPGCTAAGPMITKLAPPVPWGQFGTALASGDLNGDGVPELAVGSPYARFDNQTMGGVFLFDGQYLQGLDKHAPASAPFEWVEPGEHNRFIPGQGEGSETGRGVFIKAGHLGVVTTNDIIDNIASVSSVRLFGVDQQGELDLEPRALIVGETERPGSLLGQRDAIGLHPDRNAIILGAVRGGGTGRDNGSAYWVDLTPLTP